MVGFPDFIYKHIVPACFLAPLKPTFDLTDAQTILVSFRTFKLAISIYCVYIILDAVCNDVLFSPSDTSRMCTYIEDDL